MLRDPDAKGVGPADATLEQKLDATEEVGRIAAKGQFRRFTGRLHTDLARAMRGRAWPIRVTSCSSERQPRLEFAYPTRAR